MKEEKDRNDSHSLPPSLPPSSPYVHNENVARIPRLQPNRNRLSRKTSITHTHDTNPSRLQHTGDLRKNLQRLNQVVDAHHAGDHVEALVAEGEGGVHV